MNARSIVEARSGLVLPANSARPLRLKDGTDSQVLAYDRAEGLLSVDEKTRSAGFVISSLRRDRVGDVVYPNGCLESLADYKHTAGVFFSHCTHLPPVGRCVGPGGELDLVVDERQIVSRCYFHGLTRESDEVFALVAARVLVGASIGFIPLEAMRIDEADQPSGVINFDFGGLLFTKWALTEWSVVPVPCNPEATRHWVDHKLKSAHIVKALAPYAARCHPAMARVEKVLPGSPIFVQDGHSPAESLPKYEDPRSDAGEAPQSFFFSRTTYHSPEDVHRWLEDSGLGLEKAPVEEIEAGGDASQPDKYFAVELFDASSCEVGTTRLERVEDGVFAVFCKPHTQDNPKRPDGPKSMSEQIIEVTKEAPTNSADTEVGSQASVEAAVVVSGDAAVAVEAKSMGPEPLGSPESPAVPKAEEPMPHGCKALKDIVCGIDMARKAVAEHQPMVEHPKVAKAMLRANKALNRACDHCTKSGAEAYPDHFKFDPKDEEKSAPKLIAGKLADDIYIFLNDISKNESLSTVEKRMATSLAQGIPLNLAISSFKETPLGAHTSTNPLPVSTSAVAEVESATKSTQEDELQRRIEAQKASEEAARRELEAKVLEFEKMILELTGKEVSF